MHWFIDPIQNHYADFEGRATREQFWMYVLVYFVVYIVLNIVLSWINLENLMVLFSLALLLPSIAITARRLHDIDKSGWWQLIGLIPIVGWIIVIIWYAKQGDAGENRFGSAVAVAKADAVIDNEMPTSTSETPEDTKEEAGSTPVEESTSSEPKEEEKDEEPKM